MRKSSLRTVWWGALIAYVSIIYCTLGVMQSMWASLSTELTGKLVAALSLLYTLAGIICFAFIVFANRAKSILKYVLFFLFAWVLFKMLAAAQTPAEKIHIAEYGLVGILVYNALKIDVDRFKWRLYAYGSLLCLVSGAIDEVIQRFLPNRVFDWRDIVMNGVSGVVTLLAIRLCILTHRPGRK